MSYLIQPRTEIRTSLAAEAQREWQLTVTQRKDEHSYTLQYLMLHWHIECVAKLRDFDRSSLKYTLKNRCADSTQKHV